MTAIRPSFGRFASFALLLLLAVLALGLTGCDRIKSASRSLSRVIHPGKEKAHPAPHTPNTRASGPRLAIILDDLGSDRADADVIFSLPYPLTVSILPSHAHSAEIAEEAHRRGYQVMLHLPMQALGNETAESLELRPGMSASEISQVLVGMLDGVPHAVGVNNHQGSRATSDAALMAELMPLLRARNLFFIDSRTTAATVAFDTAQRDGVRCAFRNVPFLDDVQDVAAIRSQLEHAIHSALEKGQAIAIGHPHPETLRALRDLLPTAESQGVRLVHASDLVR